MEKAFMEIGKIVGTHGVRGEVKIEPWCDSPAFLCKFKTLYLDKDGKTALEAETLRPHKTNVLGKFKTIKTMEEAEAMRGKVLYMAKEEAHLPKNRWFITDLIGCKVLDADNGTVYGKIADVYLNPKANDAWLVKDETGKETMIPAIPSVIKQVNVEQKQVKIHALPGLFFDIESVIEDAD